MSYKDPLVTKGDNIVIKNPTELWPIATKAIILSHSFLHFTKESFFPKVNRFRTMVWGVGVAGKVGVGN